MFNRRLVRIKVLQALYAHMSAYADTEESATGESGLPFTLGKGVGEAGAVTRSLLELERSLQAYIDLQHTMVHLLLELRRANRKRIDLQKSRYLRSGLEPSENFVNNRVLQQYAANESIRAYAKQRNVAWPGAEDFVWYLFTTLEKESFFDDYLELNTPSFSDDAAVVSAIYEWLQALEIPQLADDQLDEQRTIYAWALSSTIFYYADLDSALDDLLEETGGMHDLDSADVEIVPCAIKEDLRTFALTLLKKTIEQHENNLQTIIPFLRNWDPSRVAFMDLLILLMGLAEALNFPEIPIPVTINEYIELARSFSTKSSPQFVNGVLDSMLKQLGEEGIIVKKERKKGERRAK